MKLLINGEKHDLEVTQLDEVDPIKTEIWLSEQAKNDFH